MAAFDYMIQPQGANIDISLFGDAAVQGAQYGKAVPNTLGSIAQGIQSGIESGVKVASGIQNIRQSQAQSAYYDAKAKAEASGQLDPLQAQRLKNMQLDEQLKRNELSIKLSTEETDRIRKQAESEAAAKKAQQDLYMVSTAEEIGSVLSNGLPEERGALLTDPRYAPYFVENPEQAVSVYDRTRKDMTPEQAKIGYEIAEGSKLRAQERRQQDMERAAREKISQQLGTNEQKVREDATLTSVRAAANGSLSALADMQIYPSGQKTYNKQTGMIDKNVPDKTDLEYGAQTDFMDVFDGSGKWIAKVPTSAGNKLQAYKESYRVNKEGIDPLPVTPPEGMNESGTVDRVRMGAEAAEAQIQAGELQSDLPGGNTQARPQTLGDIVNSLKGVQGVSPAATEQVVRGGLIEGQDPASSISTTRGAVEEALNEIVPGGYSSQDLRAATALSEADKAQTPGARRFALSQAEGIPSGQKLYDEVSKQATKAAAQMVEQLKSGDEDTQNSIKRFAESKGVPPTLRGFKQVFQDEALKKLSEAREKAVLIGQDMKLQKGAVSTAKKDMSARELKALAATDPSSFLKSISLKERAAARISNNNSEVVNNMPPPTQIESAVNTVDLLATNFRLSPTKVSNMKASAKHALENPLLASAPPYVKALAAQESAGGSNTGPATKKHVGLMQVGPAAAKDASNLYGRFLDTSKPEDNLIAGQVYIDHMIDRFKGNKALAYAAYNAGANTIKYAQELAGGSENWSDVKVYLREAIERYKDSIAPGENGVNRKYDETINYPEQVAIFEKAFS